MVKEITKKNIYSNKSLSIIKLESNVKSYYLYLSINKFTINDKYNYKIDYVLNNSKIDLIPNNNIFNKSEISSVYTLKYDNNKIYIYNVPNIQLFSYLDLFDYKVKTAIFEIEPNDNLFVKFFTEKKLYIKNNLIIEQVKIKNNIINELDNLMDIFTNKLSMN